MVLKRRWLIPLVLPFFLGISSCSTTDEGEGLEDEWSAENGEVEGEDISEEGEMVNGEDAEIVENEEGLGEEDFASNLYEEGELNEFDNSNNLANEEYADNSVDNLATMDQNAEAMDNDFASEFANQPVENLAAENMTTDQVNTTVANVPVANTPVGSAAAAPMASSAGMSGAVPEIGSKMPYIVRVGETMSSIAQKIYGDSAMWSEMAALTAIENPNRVRPGDVVYYKLSETTMAFASAHEAAERIEVVVQPGDTLSAIAMRVYGSYGDWKYIWRQNGDIANPDLLEVGQTISYINPASLSAEIENARSTKVADLMNNSALDQSSVEVSVDSDVSYSSMNAVQSDIVNSEVLMNVVSV